MNGKHVFTRHVDLGDGNWKSFTTELTFCEDELSDYTSMKFIIDRSADAVIETVERSLGINLPDFATEAALAKAKAMEQPITAAEMERATANHVPGQYADDGEPVKAVVLFDTFNSVMAPVTVQPAPVVEIQDDPLLTQAAEQMGVPEDVAASIIADTLDLDAELAAVPAEVDNDKLHSVCHAFERVEK